jgi:hypothetical protein
VSTRVGGPPSAARTTPMVLLLVSKFNH